MSDYVRVYNLTIKDGLPTGNSNKVIKGTELDVELNAVAAAISSKADANDPVLTGTPVAPTATFGTNTTQLATTAFVQAALKAMYPVGSVYINASSSTNPATLLGFGTWVTVGDGKVLVNQDTADTSFDTLGETGGSKDAIVVSHTHTGTTGNQSADHTHSGTTAGSGSHSHTMLSVVSGGNNFANSGPYTGGTGTTSTVGDHTHSFSTGGVSANHTHSFTTASTGSSGTNANLQPYVTVKMWKRTA